MSYDPLPTTDHRIFCCSCLRFVEAGDKELSWNGEQWLHVCRGQHHPQPTEDRTFSRAQYAADLEKFKRDQEIAEHRLT